MFRPKVLVFMMLVYLIKLYLAIAEIFFEQDYLTNLSKMHLRCHHLPL